MHQKAPSAAHSDAAGDPVQPLKQIVTLEHIKQFLELLKTAVGSNASPGSSSSVTAAPAESPAAPQSVQTKK